MPDLPSLSVFAVAFLLSAISPGPTHVALVTRSIALGVAGVVPFIAGIILGDIVWLSVAIAGLAALAATYAAVFIVVKYLGIVYLFWLAWRMWRAPPRQIGGPIGEMRRVSFVDGFLGGLSLCMGNVKVMAFYLALLPNLVDLAHVSASTYMTLVVFVVVALVLVHGSYALLALTARAALARPSAQRIANRIGAAALIGAAVVVAAR